MPGTVITRTQIANDSMTYIAPMLMVRENIPVMDKLTDKKTLPNGYGLVYNEPYLGTIAAATGTDGVEYDSPASFSDTNIQVTAIEYVIQTAISALTNDQVKENLYQKAGVLMGNGLSRKLDLTGIVQGQSFGASFGSGTATMVAGHITAASSNIRAGIALTGATARTGALATGDPSDSPIYAVIHEFQRRALAAQLSGTFSGASDGAISTTTPTMNFGTNRVGLTPYQVQWLEQHYMGNLDGVKIMTDGNIAVASTAARGFVFARDAIIHLQYRSPNHYEVLARDGRVRYITTSDTWGWGSRADVWGVVLNCAAVQPTS